MRADGSMRLSDDGANTGKRVRVDTGPLGAGDALVVREERVWPWIAGGLACLAAAWVISVAAPRPDPMAELASASTSRDARTPDAPPSSSERATTAARVTAGATRGVSGAGEIDASATATPLPTQASAGAPSAEPLPASAARDEAPAQSTQDEVVAPRPDPALARGLNLLGYSARKIGDHRAATALYRAAASADPSHVWSRYNLACELALAGFHAEALDLLDAIQRIGGADAREALGPGHAGTDGDLDSLRAEPRFRALVGGGARRGR